LPNTTRPEEEELEELDELDEELDELDEELDDFGVSPSQADKTTAVVNAPPIHRKIFFLSLFI
jgi:hypothetical protein